MLFDKHKLYTVAYTHYGKEYYMQSHKVHDCFTEDISKALFTTNKGLAKWWKNEAMAIREDIMNVYYVLEINLEVGKII